MMKSVLTNVALLVAMVAVAGCQPAANTGGSATTASGTAVGGEKAVYCGLCGEVKGTDKCCAEGAEKCECGMQKGSALCCVELSDDAKGKDMCASCGHVADEGHECDADCEKCTDCGLHKGSPLCCKVKGDDSGAEEDHSGHDHSAE